MSESDVAALRRIKDHLAPFEGGPLRNNVRTHYENLQRLTESLRKIGLDDETIDQQVLEIFNSYRTELLRNIERIADESRLRRPSGEAHREQSMGGRHD